MKKSPFSVVKSRYITEKAAVLQNLKNGTANPSLKRCESPKYVFLVDQNANKIEIAKAVEEIYADRKIKVKSVNTINVRPKQRRVRGFLGFKAGFKKAVVTLDKGDSLDEQV